MDLALRDKLMKLASEFRKAAWTYSNEINTSNKIICGFPGGCCDSASRLLAAYLEDCGYKGATYVAGIKFNEGKSKCHVWIGYKGWNIDITADQFDSVEETVIVADASLRHLGFRKIGVGVEASFRVQYAGSVYGELQEYDSVYDGVRSLILA